MLLVREATPAPRALTDDERARVGDALDAVRVAPAAVCARAAALARLVPRRPRWAEIRGPRCLVAHAAIAARAEGIALGHRIYVRRALFADDGSLPLDLLAHEVAHVAQMLRDGWVRFYLRYGAAYARGRARGLDDRRAYLSIPYEVEARAVAASVDPKSADVRVLR
ncbi:MAG TPA: DUF4157 domain-containing protein [Sandaracinaceae bacterium LLY-WYZ-13_1]|nr:DUF4157 domain-containing protein [Sandaracinaceae bacterium LLY-WYZ-13_1]